MACSGSGRWWAPPDRRRGAGRRSAPSRSAFETQSMPVSPPPITTTPLAGGADLALGSTGRAALGCGDPAVAAVEVLHREVDAVELAAGHLEVALDPRAGARTTASWPRAEPLDADVAADLDVADELDPLLLENRDPPVDDPLLELRIGHPEAQEPAGCLVALVDGDPVADLVELGRGRHPRGPRPDDGDVPAGPRLGRLGDDPPLLEGMIDRPVLDLLDHHRVVVDVEHAGRLARRRTDQAGELGEVVGRVELVDRRLPVPDAGEVVPVGNQVPERAGVVAERHAAVHAA